MAKIYDKWVTLQNGERKLHKQIVYWCPKSGRKRSRSYSDHELARRELRKLVLHEQSTLDIDVDRPSKHVRRVTVADVVTRYINDTQAGRDGAEPAERSTLTAYRGWLRNHIGPRIGDRPAETFTIEDAKAFRDGLIRDLETQGTSRRTAEAALNLCRAAFGYHNPKWRITSNPFNDARVKRSKRKMESTETVDDRDIHTEEEFQRTRQALRAKQQDRGTRGANVVTIRHWQRAEIYVLLGYLCGLRASEIRGLARSNVNFEAGSIRVEQRADAYHQIGSPKSGLGWREVPCPPSLLRKIDAYLATHSHNWVLPTDSGAVMSHSNFLKRIWGPLLKSAGVRYRKFHFTRHYYASRLIELNVNLKLLTTLMGHHSFAFTERVYGRLIERRSTKEERRSLARAILPDDDETERPNLQNINKPGSFAGGEQAGPEVGGAEPGSGD